jgi:hypothetical protein
MEEFSRKRLRRSRLYSSASLVMRIGSRANEKATRQQGGLFFSRENSSNGGKRFRQNLLDEIL